MLFRETNIWATVPSLVIDEQFAPFDLARFQIETFNKAGGSRKADLIQMQSLTNHTTDALDFEKNTFDSMGQLSNPV